MQNLRQSIMTTAEFKSFSFSYQGYFYFSAGYFALEKLNRHSESGIPNKQTQ